VIRNIRGVSTPPIRGLPIYRGLWGEPLEGFLPQSSPYVGEGLYRHRWRSPEAATPIFSSLIEARSNWSVTQIRAFAFTKIFQKQ